MPSATASCSKVQGLISTTPGAAWRWCRPTDWIDVDEARAALAARTVETDGTSDARDVWLTVPDADGAEPGTVVAKFVSETIWATITRNAGPARGFWVELLGADRQVVFHGKGGTFAESMAMVREALERWAAGEASDRSRCAS